jgi:Stress responsive A/B Barrel Domain
VIAHVILFKPKSGVTAEERQVVLDGLRAAATKIPTIRRLRVGRRVRHGLPGYEQFMRDDFEYAMVVEFDDLDGLKAYLSHPDHAALGRHFVQSSAAALAYDYEMEDWK